MDGEIFVATLDADGSTSDPPYNSRDLSSLEERSHKPKRLRRPSWSRELALAVLHLREQYPRWGKDKLAVLLRERGWEVSTSMVGRILSHLKAW